MFVILHLNSFRVLVGMIVSDCYDTEGGDPLGSPPPRNKVAKKQQQKTNKHCIVATKDSINIASFSSFF